VIQVILNTGDAYQTVTIVPSEAGSGEVSYVLIVQQPDDKDGDKGEGDGEDQDLTVYDFDEGEEGMPVVRDLQILWFVIQSNSKRSECHFEIFF
jgi:hypothetical protein